MERERAIALIEGQHSFPGPFALRAIVRPGGQSVVVTAVRATLGDTGALLEVEEISSAQGRYHSVRLKVHVNGAEDVLALYEVLKGIDAVIMTL